MLENEVCDRCMSPGCVVLICLVAVVKQILHHHFSVTDLKNGASPTPGEEDEVNKDGEDDDVAEEER